MAPTMQLALHTAGLYQPTSDALDRHEYGVHKSKKPASTGGGRAWSEDEEAYLLQTRLQKMPYKHIAAHLKKTELACRLHFHQLSHGSNRRKRTTSMSSGSSTGHSPIIPTTMPSPIRETPSRSASPGSAGGYLPNSPMNMGSSILLPSIMTGGSSTSPRLPAILPKPLPCMTLPHLSTSQAASPTTSRGYPTPLSSDGSHSAAYPSFPTPVSATHSVHGHVSSHPSQGMAPLRLDCSGIPRHSGPPSAPAGKIDMGRLQSIYTAHRSAFWAGIASEYGAGANPYALESAWKYNSGHGQPMTPVMSPDNDRDSSYTISTSRYNMATGSSTGISGISGINVSQANQDKTRISAILGIDANPRSPKEKEMVRRLEEERTVGVISASA